MVRSEAKCGHTCLALSKYPKSAAKVLKREQKSCLADVAARSGAKPSPHGGKRQKPRDRAGALRFFREWATRSATPARCVPRAAKDDPRCPTIPCARRGSKRKPAAMSPDEPASQPSPDASSASQPRQYAEQPSMLHGKRGEHWTCPHGIVTGFFRVPGHPHLIAHHSCGACCDAIPVHPCE